MPFITEEIWQRIRVFAGKSGDTIMTQPYPTADESKIDEIANGDIEWLKGVILAVRNIRGEMDISPAKPIPVFFKNGSSEDLRRLSENDTYLKKLAKLEQITVLGSEEAPMSATQLVGDMEILVPMAGLIDKAAEITRLEKEIDKATKELQRLQGKLGNEKFVANAPADVVEKEQAKLADINASHQVLTVQLEKIRNM
jgi:valyl-tRNA synthetase